MKKTLRPYQVDDLAFHIANPKSLNLSDPGTGKTGPACVLQYYWATELGFRVIWSQPKSLLHKNRDELFAFTEFQPNDIEILQDPVLSASPGQISRLKRYMNGEPVKISRLLKRYPQHWDKLIRGQTVNLIAESKAKVVLCGFRFLARFWQDFGPDFKGLVIDELHMAYGSNTSQNTKALYGLMRRFTHFMGMTGTLLNGRLDTCFPAIHVIEPRYYGSFARFRHEHVAFEDEYGRVLSWKNHDKLGAIILRHSIRHTFEEVYGKEDTVFQLEPIEMGEEMREKYDEFHDAAMLELEDGFLDGSLPGVATIRARQILGHPETFGLCKNEENGKDERLKVFTHEGGPQLIFSVHIPEQARLVSVLEGMGRRVGLMNGSTSTEERNRIDQEFRAGLLDDVVGSPETMAVGWNWEQVDHVICVSIDYRDVSFLQAYRRANRGTRTKPLRVTVLAYVESVDYRVISIVQTKAREAHRVDPTRPLLEFL